MGLIFYQDHSILFIRVLKGDGGIIMNNNNGANTKDNSSAELSSIVTVTTKQWIYNNLHST